MEVETRPPLVDGQLGLHALRSSPDLGLSITENDILSDEERELLQSPVEDRISCVKDNFVNSSERDGKQEDVSSESSSSLKCNGDVSTESVSDAANVFRTESKSEEVRGTELDGGNSKVHPGGGGTTSTAPSVSEEENCSQSPCVNSSFLDGPCDVASAAVIIGDVTSAEGVGEDVTSAEGVVEEVASADAIVGDVTSAERVVDDVTSAEGVVEEVASAEGVVEEVASAEGVVEEVASADAIIGDVTSAERVVDDVTSAEGVVEEVASAEGVVEEVASTDVIVGDVTSAEGVVEDVTSAEGVVEDVTSVEGVVEDVKNTEGVVEDSLHNSESHVSGNQNFVDCNPQDNKLKTNAGAGRRSSSIESNGDVKSSNQGEKNEVEGVLSAQLSGLSPKSLKDFDDLDEMEIPQVIDISSIGENENASFPVEDETVASDGIALNEKGNDDVAAEYYEEDKAGAVDPMVDESMGFDQEEDDSPGYHGMTDDILPIIESELDDIPVGEGNIFDTEVECGDSTSMEEPENQDDETIADSPADIDIADNESSHLVSENSRTADEGSEECLIKKDLRDKFSSSARVKLKRRASADHVSTPPQKVKRQSSLDSLNECAERSDRAASIEEFKKLSRKKPLAGPKNIASEPLDIPIEIEKNEEAAKPAKRKKIETVADPEVLTETGVKEKEPSGDGKESLLVIDLDDDDKVNSGPSTGESHSGVPEQAESSKSAPRSALDVLFNGKKEITLNRKMFTRIMKSFVSQYLLTFSELGKATSLSLKANSVLTRIQSNVSSYEKQKDDFKSIMNKLIEDRQARKTWDETLVPPKATRSVGLQVCSVGSIYMKNAPNTEGTSSKTISRSKFQSSSSHHQNQALIQQKQAYAQQQMALAQSKVKQAELQMASMRPIAKKSVTPTNRPVAIKTVLATKPLVQPKPKPVSQLPVTSPKLNGLKAVSVTRNPEPAGAPNTAPITVTTASPNSRTFTLSNRGTYATKSPHKTIIQMSPQSKPISTLLSKALTSADVAGKGNSINVAPKPGGNSINVAPKPGPQNAAKAVPVALTRTPGSVQNSKNLTSGPGRPGKSPVPVSPPDFLSSPSAITSSVVRVLNIPAQLDKLKKTVSAPDTTIDLTDLDDDAPQPTKPPVTSNTTARKSTSSASRAALLSQVPNVALNSKQMRHPALPPNPPNFNPQFAPPRPYLGICDTQTVTQGIMLTWHFNSVIPRRKISKFQVFAYQETKGDGEDAWKKVGDVDALPLPMACTLTQFREGYTYHFIVRALDEAGNVGPFSAPNTITLMKKTV